MENTLGRCFTVKGNTAVIEFLGGGIVKKTIDLETRTSRKLNKILSSFYSDTNGLLPLVFHEVLMLSRLEKFAIAPQVLEVNHLSFTMTNVGKPVKKNTKFNDLKKRVDYILRCLNLVGISHNDLRRSFQNYTCLEGDLYLVDFQLADIKVEINVVPSTVMRKKLKPRSWNDEEDLNWLLTQFG